MKDGSGGKHSGQDQIIKTSGIRTFHGRRLNEQLGLSGGLRGQRARREERGQIRKRADQSTVGATASGEMVNVN